MTQEQMDRLDNLATKDSWTLDELQELNRLYKLFYKTFRIYVCVEDLKDDIPCDVCEFPIALCACY